MSKLKIVIFVPLENAENMRKAVGQAGAGQLGEYTFCSYSVIGKTRFLAGQNTDPSTGEPGEFTVSEEERIEVVCDRDKANLVFEAIRSVHPDEEVVFDIIPLLQESEI